MTIAIVSNSYNTSTSDKARFAQSSIEAKLEKGGPEGVAIVQAVHAQMPQDAVVAGRALAFAPASSNSGLMVRLGNGAGMERFIHRHALGQMAGKAGVPGAYLADLAGGNEWQRELGAEILNRHYHLGEAGTRHLVRSVKGEVRGFLSDRYRRLDSRPLIDAFATECRKVGARLAEGTATDVRWSLKAFLPMVFEPVPNEVLCLGVEIGNSDFGAAKYTIRPFLWRVICANGAVMEDSLAQVHLGRVLSDDIQFSDRTYQLDTQTSVSATHDIVKGLLGPAKVNAFVETIRNANEKSINWRTLRTSLAKKLLKEELKAVEEAFTGDDVVMMPPGETAWRASNAISWIAGKATDAERRLELQRVAGEVVAA